MAEAARPSPARHELAADIQGERLDAFLARRLAGLSRSYAQHLIEAGLVEVAGRAGHPTKSQISWGPRAARPALRLRPGDRVLVTVPPPEILALEPQAIPLKVVYDDSDIIVVDKPSGMVVHPAPGHRGGTLVNALLAHCPDLAGVGGALRPGIVHRLDKETSGLIVAAKNDRAHQHLARQLKERQVHKVYIALVHVRLEPLEGEIDAPIGRHPVHRKRMAVVEGGRQALTRYRALSYLEGFTLVQAMPITGRTHQIRVHMAHRGHPVAGDAVYGRGRPSPAPRLFLHAHRLGFRLPSDGRYVEFESPLPEELAAALSRMA